MENAIEKNLVNGYDDMDVTIYFDFQPEEKATTVYPGCRADVNIYKIELADGTEIELLPDAKVDMESEILEYYWANQYETAMDYDDWSYDRKHGL